MATPIQSTDLAALIKATEALISPLDFPTTGEWLAESLRRVREVSGADASVIVGPEIPPAGAASPDLPADIVTRLAAVLRFRGGELHWVDPAVDAAFGECRRNPSRVYTMGQVRTLVGSRMEQTAVFQTVIAPTGLLGSASIAVIAPGSETVLSALSLRPEQMEVQGSRLAGMHVLRRALAAGLATFHRIRDWRGTLAVTLDEVGTGLAIFDRRGCREVVRNAALLAMLREEPERVRLCALISRLGRQVCTGELTLGGEGAAGLTHHDEEVELAGGIYRLVGSRVGAGTLVREPAVLVLVDRLSGQVPTTGELRVTFGLKGREATITLLAARGLSNKAIARRLGLSEHTVRHYLERIFDRLDVHSRKSLLFNLIFASGKHRVDHRGPGVHEAQDPEGSPPDRGGI